MKLTIKFDPSLNQMMKKIKIKLSNFIYFLIKKPYYDWKEKRDVKNYNQKNHDIFKKYFRVTAKDIKDLMIKSDDAGRRAYGKNVVKMSDEEYQEFLKEQLKKNASECNSMKQYIKASFFYDPEICEIHNENIKEHEGPAFNQLVAIENEKSRNDIRYQEKKNPSLNTTDPKQDRNRVVKNTNDIDIQNISNIRENDIKQLKNDFANLKEILDSSVKKI